MPPLSPLSFPLLPRSGTSGNATDLGLEVVCAWPVSGQYGPGTRVLYYVLIAACVFARKEEWIRNACLAGALLFPAIAALHGIVLATVHVDGAIDMDVYGAFQLCSIGILTAPLTARMSGTYFKDPRRNIIFLWTGLVLSGLLSITVELFRVKPITCTHDDNGNPLTGLVSQFPYGTTCDLRCSVKDGPFSPIRRGATNEIYVVPAPNKLTFGTATLLAAACCIPAIVSILYFWSLILQETWDARFKQSSETDPRDLPIEGTNGATVGKMQQINGLVRTVLSTVEAPVFAAAVLAILILGEKNFFSTPVDYGTEPMASIGQWAPIVGTGLAVIGSLYVFLTSDDENKSEPSCKCTCHETSESQNPACAEGGPSAPSTEAHLETADVSVPDEAHTRLIRRLTPDHGSRRRITRVLVRLGTSLSIAAHDRLHDYEFKEGPALDFPEIPAEPQRNGALQQIREQYNRKRDSSGNSTLSRVGSNASMASYSISPCSSRQSTRSRSPSPFRASSPSRSTGVRNSSELQNTAVSPSADDPLNRPRRRTNTLEVPVPVHHVPTRRSPSVLSISSSTYTIPGGQTSPTIVVSADDDDESPATRDSDTNTGSAYYSDSPLTLRNGRRFTS
ncbi:hypothetical protein BJY01DRAFT_254283 [Aspergillus pseudoustus]|uniref:Uncharacterized protein n=1 Tax=Aspergillus pseudoustus TaxID=1810923 RepID=A0ABR4IUB7_9EURO